MGIPPRFWNPVENPFKVESSPLEWWEDRFNLSYGGRGFLIYDLPGETSGLSSLCELFKRIVISRDRPNLIGAKVTSCKYVRASDVLRMSRSNSDWYDLVEVGFLLVSGISENLGPLSAKVLPELFQSRYEAGGVTFFHLILDCQTHSESEIQNRAQSLMRNIPTGAYIS